MSCTNHDSERYVSDVLLVTECPVFSSTVSVNYRRINNRLPLRVFNTEGPDTPVVLSDDSISTV